MRSLLDVKEWIDDNTINVFIVAMRNTYLDFDSAKIWPIGCGLARTIVLEYRQSKYEGRPFKIQGFWVQQVNGGADDEQGCPAWWNLDYVSCVDLDKIH